jgi:hypothetical protein
MVEAPAVLASPVVAVADKKLVSMGLAIAIGFLAVNSVRWRSTLLLPSQNPYCSQILK